MSFVRTWMEPESIMLSEGSQREREIQYDLTDNVEPKKKTRQTQNRLVIAGSGGWSWAEG